MSTRTAIIMIDMTKSYFERQGVNALGFPPVWELDRVVAECAELIAEARAQGMPIIYTHGRGRYDDPGASPSMRKLMAALPKDFADFDPDGLGGEFMDELAPQAGDIIVPKPRPDAFFNTDLDNILRDLDITRIVVAGLQTNVCVEATARNGLMKNFEVAVPEDAVSTDGRQLHINGLNSMRIMFIEVAPWRELLAPGAPWDRAFTTPAYGRLAEDALV